MITCEGNVELSPSSAGLGSGLGASDDTSMLNAANFERVRGLLPFAFVSAAAYECSPSGLLEHVTSFGRFAFILLSLAPNGLVLGVLALRREGTM